MDLIQLNFIRSFKQKQKPDIKLFFAMKEKIISWYSIVLGVSVIFLWTFVLKPASQEEGKLEMGFHLMSEFLMACFCIVSGIKLLLKHRESTLLLMLAHGMVIYSTANAAGYYGEREAWPMTFMFLFLFSISLVIIGITLRSWKKLTQN